MITLEYSATLLHAKKKGGKKDVVPDMAVVLFPGSRGPLGARAGFLLLPQPTRGGGGLPGQNKTPPNP